MLEVSHYTKRYGKVLACDDISFSLPSGSVTVLLGPNGAGKSTLLKGIIGFLRFDGKILVNGLSNTAPESRRIIDSVDMLWDRAIIMQNGAIRRDITREELAGSGESLEEVFFDVTEGESSETDD
ncbi:MAG: ATP-binding cassette domain-containing protein [Parasporobacterium sp.]|nr:ATP-binding cassette domain-containing protein [Parasporobacterium sp.]